MRRVAALALVATLSACYATTGTSTLDRLDTEYAGTPCYWQMRSAIENTGNLDWPDKIEKHDTSDYHTQTWLWYEQSKSMTFEWGENIDGCDISTSSG